MIVSKKKLRRRDVVLGRRAVLALILFCCVYLWLYYNEDEVYVEPVAAKAIEAQRQAIQSDSKLVNPVLTADESISPSGVQPHDTISASAPNKASGTHSEANIDIDQFVKVFIGVKTREQGIHGHRLSQIQHTWLKNAVAAMETVTIKFFCDQSDTRKISRSPNGTIVKDHLMVPVPTCKGPDFRCKTPYMLNYFLNHDTDSAFFCNFDDDNYVLITNLLQVLTDYHVRDGLRNVYVGRDSLQGKGFHTSDIFNHSIVHFLTGGAGYCLSRELLERGREHFPNPPSYFPDDIAVGYVVQEKMGIKLMENDLFHSHLESNLLKHFPTPKIAQQVSFGFNNKLKRHLARSALPQFPDELFSAEEDPMFFKSLRCHILRQRSEAAAEEDGCPAVVA